MGVECDTACKENNNYVLFRTFLFVFNRSRIKKNRWISYLCQFSMNKLCLLQNKLAHIYSRKKSIGFVRYILCHFTVKLKVMKL